MQEQPTLNIDAPGSGTGSRLGSGGSTPLFGTSKSLDLSRLLALSRRPRGRVWGRDSGIAGASAMPGRPARPWFYASKNSWYLWICSKKVKLKVQGKENRLLLAQSVGE